ncbi:MAG: DUF4407 domain-containing protein, partial [Bacteroidota bacterium]
MKKLKEFFWFCAGANSEILHRCPTEQAKYMGIGGTILFTAIMAGLAGGYAFESAFGDPRLSVPFGIFWGLMIFNLDRYIVSSTGKGDGTSKITRDEWTNALPRLAMAILLGFVIATPLELRLFEKEISMEIETLKQERRAEAREQIGGNYGELEELELKIVALESATSEKGAARDEAYNAMIAEAEGQSGSGRPGAGKIYRDKKSQYDKQEREYQELKSGNDKKIAKLEARIQDLKQSQDEEVANIDNIAGQYDGLMAKLEAFGKLTARYPAMNVAKWMISIMLILIEIAPILFKMMTERGPYDDVVERIKHVTQVQEMEAIAKANAETQTNVALAQAENEARLKVET